jgi:hypothetical protein
MPSYAAKARQSPRFRLFHDVADGVNKPREQRVLVRIDSY